MKYSNAAAVVVAFFVTTSVTSAPLAQTFTEYPIPTGGSTPMAIVAGPDGNMWFVEFSGRRIARVTTDGTFTEYPSPAGGFPPGIVLGPDARLWFAEQSSDTIGAVTSDGIFTTYPLPMAGARPNLLTVGPDGNVWFTEYDSNKIGKISLAGTVTEYSIPNAGASPIGIAGGSDGRIWFTETGRDSIGAVTVDGIVTEYPVPTAGAAPYVITSGPDGNMWFTERGAGKIGRITPAGVVQEYLIPSVTPDVVAITSGLDGNLWFTMHNADKIGRITPDGVITEYGAPTASGPHYIAVGPDGNLWITENTANAVARVAGLMATPGATPTASATPVPTPSSVCGAGPRDGCRSGGSLRSTVLLKDRIPDARDLLVWRWTRGTGTLKQDFGDPLFATDYSLCVYDRSGSVPALVLAARIPAAASDAGKPCWKGSARGYRFRCSPDLADGIVSLALKEGLEGRAQFVVKGLGVALQMPSLPLAQDPEIVAQLANSQGICWEARFTAPAETNQQPEFRDAIDTGR